MTNIVRFPRRRQGATGTLESPHDELRQLGFVPPTPMHLVDERKLIDTVATILTCHCDATGVLTYETGFMIAARRLVAETDDQLRDRWRWDLAWHLSKAQQWQLATVFVPPRRRRRRVRKP